MFEMKSASFAVNDRTLLHPAFASSKVGSMASSATTVRQID
jgi:hypothetical protein